MIDRESRNQMALALRRLGSGRITVYEFDDISTKLKVSDDPILRAVHREAYWAFVNAGPSRYVGSNRLSRESRRSIARTVLFLISDHEFDPSLTPMSTFGALLGDFLWCLCLGPLLRKVQVRTGRRKPDPVVVWPFSSGEELQSLASRAAFSSTEPNKAG